MTAVLKLISEILLCWWFSVILIYETILVTMLFRLQACLKDQKTWMTLNCRTRILGGPPMMHHSSLCSFYSPWPDYIIVNSVLPEVSSCLIYQMILCTCDIIVVINSCFPVPTGIFWMVLWCFFPSFLSSLTPTGRGGWPPFLSLVLPEVSFC